MTQFRAISTIFVLSFGREDVVLPSVNPDGPVSAWQFVHLTFEKFTNGTVPPSDGKSFTIHSTVLPIRREALLGAVMSIETRGPILSFWISQIPEDAERASQRTVSLSPAFISKLSKFDW
jgi:hypothetical protein